MDATCVPSPGMAISDVVHYLSALCCCLQLTVLIFILLPYRSAFATPQEVELLC